MSHLSRLNRYYVYGMPFSLIVIIFLFFLKVEVVAIGLCTIGFFWGYSLYTPGLKEKILKKRNRFSFITLSFHFYQLIKGLLPCERWPFLLAFARVSMPLILSFIFYFISREANPLYTVLGWSFLELFLWIDLKVSLNLAERI
jgi:hypothetical protein